MKLRNAGMNKKITLIICGTLVNHILFLICSKVLQLPVWFDTTGTALTAIFGGFVPAAIVGILQILLSCFHWGFSAIPFVVVHFAQAAVFALLANKIRDFVSLCGVVFMNMIVRIFSNIAVMMITGNGLVNYYEIIGFNAFQAEGFPVFVSYLFALFTTNVQESVGMAIILFIGYKIFSKWRVKGRI